MVFVVEAGSEQQSRFADQSSKLTTSRDSLVHAFKIWRERPSGSKSAGENPDQIGANPFPLLSLDKLTASSPSVNTSSK